MKTLILIGAMALTSLVANANSSSLNSVKSYLGLNKVILHTDGA